MNEYGIIDPQPESCNHKINSINTSIVLLPNFKTFTIPENIFGVCKFCGKPFHYLMDEKGNLTLCNEDKEEGNVND